MRIATIEDIRKEFEFRNDPTVKRIAYYDTTSWLWDREHDNIFWETKNKDYINIRNLSYEHLENILNLFYYKEFKKCLENTKIQDLQKALELIKNLNKYN